METLGNTEQVQERLREVENAAFLDLIDRSFGCGPGQSMRKVCPTSLAASNREHHYGLRRGDVLVSVAAALLRPWVTSWGVLEVAVVGCFATEPGWRGQGLSRRLQTQLLSALRHEAVDMVVLWTDQPELYHGRGFRACGHETHLSLTGLSAAEWPREDLRWATPEDAARLNDLYCQHPWRAKRSIEDWRSYLDPSVSRVRVAQRDGVAVAYAALGKGHDFEGYIHEFAGDPAAVHALWQSLRSQGATQALVPTGAEPFLGGAATHCERWTAGSAFALQLSSRTKEHDLAAWEFAAWGFDSA